MKCVTYNIQYGLGSDNRYDLKRIASEIADADVIALQEVDRFWQRSGMVDSPAVIAQELPEHHMRYGANLDMDASYVEAGCIIHRRKQFGTMVMSLWPILSSRNHLLPKWGDRKNHSIQQGILEAVIDTPIGPLRVYSVHLSHLCPETRLPQIQSIMAMLERAPKEGGAWCGGHPDQNAGWTEEDEPPMPDRFILMGDLNFAPASTEYTTMIGPKTERFGRLTNRAGILDAWTVAGHNEQAGSTHPNANQRIDHIFISSNLESHVQEMWVDNNAIGSDHYPVWARFA